LGYLTAPCTGDRLAHLRLKRRADKRRHVLLGFTDTELLRCSHAELLKRLLAIRGAGCFHRGGEYALCANVSGTLHLEGLDVGAEAGLGSTHLGRTKLASLHKLWATHAKVTKLRHTDLLCAELAGAVLAGGKRPKPCCGSQTLRRVKLARTP
jgi:hypothetical protein